jgi:hypothetical protein
VRAVGEGGAAKGYGLCGLRRLNALCSSGQDERNCFTSPHRRQVPVTLSPAGVSIRK